MREVFKLYKIIKRSNQYHKKGDKLFVSNFGRCKINDEIVEPHIGDRFGHLALCGEFVHRMVYEIFVEPIPEGYDIHHKNHNKKDNSVNNLELLSHTEHARKHSTGKNHPMYGKHHTNESKQKMSEAHKGICNAPKKPVLQYTKEGFLFKNLKA